MLAMGGAGDSQGWRQAAEAGWVRPGDLTSHRL